jgi:hypothetical protein
MLYQVARNDVGDAVDCIGGIVSAATGWIFIARRGRVFPFMAKWEAVVALSVEVPAAAGRLAVDQSAAGRLAGDQSEVDRSAGD